MSIDASHEPAATKLRAELDRLRSEPLGRCPACCEPVSFEQPYIRVNGRYTHASCARDGVYREVPRLHEADG